ncbi:uncharacterized protein BROUX77_002584 [Berkeleyomyces rouxiae]|uniref:uncharacterized protein n=1 Tax=Berkeleyomyces rouxiae TaxID=2035830 RepID=UPI003B7DECB0
MGARGTYIDVVLNKTCSTSAFVDSGCLCLATVSPRTATRAHAAILPICPRPIAQVVDDRNPPVIDQVAVFDLGLGGLDEKLYAYIVPGQSEDLILGQGWIAKHDASLRPAQNEVFIRLPTPLRLTTTTADPNVLPVSARAIRAFQLRARRSPNVRIFSATLHDIEKALKAKIYTDPRANCPEWLLPVIDAFDRKKASELPPNRPGIDTEIRLKPGLSPPSCPLYSMSREELLLLRKTLYDLLDAGFIRASSAEGGAPVIFVKKPGGGLRFCVDYRALNSVTEKDGYPLPLINDTLRDIAAAKYVSKVDVISAFHRLRLKEGSEAYTAFRTHLGAYEWLVTPFGLTGAPAAFQRFINHVLSRWLGISCSAYLDDVVIYSSDSHEHHRDLVRQIIRALGDAGLQLDWDKSEFESPSIKYLGFIVEPGSGIRADPDKVKAIQEWEAPTSVRGVRSFLGFANFYRCFVPEYSTVAAPLTLLTKKDQPFKWEDEQLRSFEALKKALVSAPLLATFDPDLPTIVEADASGWALGGSLRQQGADSLWRPVAYFSRKLSPAEVNYPIHDKEMLAIHSCLRAWRSYLAGIPFEVHTDHQNLLYFQKQRTLSERQRRWAHELSEFDFRLIHRPGVTQVTSDALSRRDQDLPQDLSDERLQSRVHQVLRPDGPDFVIAAAVWAKEPDKDPEGTLTLDHAALDAPFADPELQTLWHSALTRNERYWQARQAVQEQARSFPNEWGLPWQISECTLDSATRLLWRDRLWIPYYEPLRTRIIQQVHDSTLTGHPGGSATRDLVSRSYAWPGLSDDVRRFVGNCDTCGKSKIWRDQKRGLLKPLPVPDRAWQELAMDFIVGLPESEGCTTILGITDRLSKSKILIPMQSYTAPDVARAFITHVFAHHGLPRAITSDRGPQFTGLFWTEVCRQLSITRRLSTAFHPETDGAQERSNQEIETYLRAFTAFLQDDWAALLPQAQVALNNRTATATGLSPFFFTHGYNIDPLDLTTDHEPGSTVSPATAGHNWLAKHRDATAFAQASMAVALETQERHANRGRQAAEAFKVGDRVYLRLRNVRTIRPSKTLDWLALPYRVIQIVGTHAVKLDTPTGIHPVFHVSLVRRARDDPLPSQVLANPEPPAIAPEEASGDLVAGEYLVDEILRHKVVDKRHKVLVQWTGWAEPTLTDLFCASPVLRLFDHSLPTTVEADSSGYSTGAVLLQQHPDGLFPCAYISQKLSPAESNYEIHDKEMLAIVRALKEWRGELRGAQGPIRVLTDHKNLLHFTSAQQLTERQARWANLLSEFDLTLEHRPGKLSPLPDALSRLHMPSGPDDPRLQARNQQLLQCLPDGALKVRSARVTLPSPFRKEALSTLWEQALSADSDYAAACAVVASQAPKWPDSLKTNWRVSLSECSLDSEGRLRYRSRLWVPQWEPLRTALLQEIHDSVTLVHPGQRIMCQEVSKTYFWPHYTADVKRFCRNCEICGSTNCWGCTLKDRRKPDTNTNGVSSKD